MRIEGATFLSAAGLPALRSVCNNGATKGFWVIFFRRGEPSSWRAGDIGTSLLPKQRPLYFTAFLDREKSPNPSGSARSARSDARIACMCFIAQNG
jgi:hypothetical protein